MTSTETTTAELDRRLAAWHAGEADRMEAEPETNAWRTRRIMDHRRAVREYDKRAAEHERAAAAPDRADEG